MPSFRIVDNRTNVAKKINKLETLLDNFVEDVLESVAQRITAFSPVDTGTYITSHRLTSGRNRVVRVNSSANKPRGVERAPKVKQGVQILRRDIKALDTSTASNIFISNIAKHANTVELKYLTYSATKRELPAIVQRIAKRS